MNKYYGYVYLWWNTLEQLYYVGGHVGKVEDKYVCSNTMLKGIHNRRPETLRFRVLEYIQTSTEDLRAKEQYWLNMIKAEELYLGSSPKYFNLKKLSAGGNGSANKGNSNIGGSNRHTWKITEPDGTVVVTDKLQAYCLARGLSKSTLYVSYRDKRKITRGPCKNFLLEKN
jgi:hypothetical protein